MPHPERCRANRTGGILYPCALNQGISSCGHRFAKTPLHKLFASLYETEEYDHRFSTGKTKPYKIAREKSSLLSRHFLRFPGCQASGSQRYTALPWNRLLPPFPPATSGQMLVYNYLSCQKVGPGTIPQVRERGAEPSIMPLAERINPIVRCALFRLDRIEEL